MKAFHIFCMLVGIGFITLGAIGAPTTSPHKSMAYLMAENEKNWDALAFDGLVLAYSQSYMNIKDAVLEICKDYTYLLIREDLHFITIGLILFGFGMIGFIREKFVEKKMQPKRWVME